MADRPKICVADAETDPFLADRVPKPFVWGFYDGTKFRHWWGDNCTERFVGYLRSLKGKHIIYWHNGGKFDAHMGMLEHFNGNLKLVNGRILEAQFSDDIIFRDSFGILPFPLAAYQKTEINYEKMERTVREENRDEIVLYLKDDCTDLLKLVLAFWDEFGNRLTMAGASSQKLRKFHKYEKIKEETHDAFLRQYYYGGRVQCFKTGIIHQPVKIYDVNSMYPDVMRNYRHPFCAKYSAHSRRISGDTAFATIEAINRGALPFKNPKTGSLSFTEERGIFNATIHEIEAGLDTGTLEILKVIRAVDFAEWGTFEEFVDHFYTLRLNCKAVGDKIHELLYKYLLNGGYGRTAINPRDHVDNLILPNGETPWQNKKEDQVHYVRQLIHPKYTIWGRPVADLRFENVAIGASITGAARSKLLRGLAKAVDPVYCDTDSIMCRELAVSPDPKKLGAWKFEGEGDTAAIAGKKLYAIFGDQGATLIKKAHKGGKLTPSQIIAICNGVEVEASSDVPAFKITGQHQFVKRRFRMTG